MATALNLYFANEELHQHILFYMVNLTLQKVLALSDYLSFFCVAEKGFFPAPFEVTFSRNTIR